MKLRFIAVSLSLLSSACFLAPNETQLGLQSVDAGSSSDAGSQADGGVDDFAKIAGRLCLQQPNPVKIVLVVDQSGSMCLTDPPGSQGTSGFCEAFANSLTTQTVPARIRALSGFVGRLGLRPNVSVAMVPFDTRVRTSWPTAGGFAAPDSSLTTRIQALQNELGKGTDYQGALTYVKSLIETDAQSLEASVRARTQYAVIFLSDGVPFPRCAANDTLTTYADDLHPDLTWADTTGAADFCNQVQPQGSTDTLFDCTTTSCTAWVAGTDRNQPAQLYGQVDSIVGLKQQYGVADIRFDTAMLFNAANARACGAICQDVYGVFVRYPGAVPVADNVAAADSVAEHTLLTMAQHGQGEFVQFQDGAIENMTIDLEANALAQHTLGSLILDARSSVPGVSGRLVDSDGDGVSDVDERSAQTDPANRDTDGDGFSDAFELSHGAQGFSPTVIDTRGCDPHSTTCDIAYVNGDEISTYEAAYFSFPQTSFDWNSNLVPNAIEVRDGLDPTLHLLDDTDGDGVNDTIEIGWGSNPRVADLPYSSKYAYSVVTGEQGGNLWCVDFSISNVQLVKTSNGANLFRVWFSDSTNVPGARAVWKSACAWASYDASGAPRTVELAPENFYDPRDLSTPTDYATRCVGTPP